MRNKKTISRVTEYVCGLLFTLDRQIVVLIRKNRPENQAGKLNGVGGKIEPNETALEAMNREFLEEANVADLDWTQMSEITGDDYRVVFFHAVATHDVIATVRSMTDEEIELHHVQQLGGQTLVEGLQEIIDQCLANETSSAL